HHVRTPQRLTRPDAPITTRASSTLVQALRYRHSRSLRRAVPDLRATDRKAWRRAEAGLRHEPVPGRLHRRAGRRSRLERAERRAVSVVARPGAGDWSVAVWAQAVGDHEFLLADRRPAAGCHPGPGRVRAELAGYAEGGVLVDGRQG